jgi:hypothetical protein
MIYYRAGGSDGGTTNTGTDSDTDSSGNPKPAAGEDYIMMFGG